MMDVPRIPGHTFFGYTKETKDYRCQCGFIVGNMGLVNMEAGAAIVGLEDQWRAHLAEMAMTSE